MQLLKYITGQQRHCKHGSKWMIEIFIFRFELIWMIKNMLYGMFLNYPWNETEYLKKIFKNVVDFWEEVLRTTTDTWVHVKRYLVQDILWISGVSSFIFIRYGHHAFLDYDAASLSACDTFVHLFRERVSSHFWRERSLNLDVKWRDSYGGWGWLQLKCSYEKLDVINPCKYVTCNHHFGEEVRSAYF